MRFALLFVFAALSVAALRPVAYGLEGQTNWDAPAGLPASVSNSPAETVSAQTNEGLSLAQQLEQARTACIDGRRSICGKILKVLPDGLVVDSGYTNLLRAPLNRSWFAPGTVSATRTSDAIEGSQPNSICLGLFFLTNLPKPHGAHGAKPKLYDYVMIEGYPAGQYTYTSVGDVHRTVRRFSASLDAAVRWKLQSMEKK